ncbi:MAG TPA: alpha-D-ribose 1-methylphosphonate 5-triphosphate diphosphatase [Aggregatilineales bacterium]|nr:alpha-D-ribose 1-methylphosphonate 5-triphosphate diphosphatase [Aggregatilineales bacterium]
MWLSDLRVVLPDRVLERASVRIVGAQIADIVEGPVSGAEVRGTGLTLIPGLVDLHGDMLEREIEPRPGAPFPVGLALFELDKRLAGTGITTAFTALSFAWNEEDHMRSDKHTRRVIETVETCRPSLLVDTYVHGRFEVTNALVGPLLTEMLDARKIQLVSFMDHTPGQGQYKDIEKYVDFIVKWLGVNREDIEPDFLINRIKARIAKQQERRWSWNVVSEAMRIARAHGIAVASHDDDTAAKVERLAGLGVSISEFPVTLEAAQTAKDHGQHVVMGAPNALRGYSHSGNLSTVDAIKAGVVDILAVDYYPATALHAPFELAAQGLLTLPEAINLVSWNPARAAGFQDRGKIGVGYRADLAIVETTANRRVRGTIRQGTPIYWDNVMVERSARELVSE